MSFLEYDYDDRGCYQNRKPLERRNLKEIKVAATSPSAWTVYQAGFNKTKEPHPTPAL